jgi:hypothetical protein
MRLLSPANCVRQSKQAANGAAYVVRVARRCEPIQAFSSYIGDQ